MPQIRQGRQRTHGLHRAEEGSELARFGTSHDVFLASAPKSIQKTPGSHWMVGNFSSTGIGYVEILHQMRLSLCSINHPKSCKICSVPLTTCRILHIPKGIETLWQISPNSWPNHHSLQGKALDHWKNTHTHEFPLPA